jgi:hypothetical protein
MSFTIQHPVSGLSWATDTDGKIVLSSKSASIYTVDDETHIRNTTTDLCVRNLGSEFFETEHYGSMPEFEWTMADDGAISGPPAYGAWWVGEDLTVSATPFAWKKVLPTRASALKATASVAPAAAPVQVAIDPETFSSAV